MTITTAKKILIDITNELKLDNTKYNPILLQYIISKIKVNDKNSFEDPNVENIFKKYQIFLKSHNAVDYDDLIKLPIEILKNNKDILEKYRNKWKYILIDEYQDTSIIQFEFIRLLAAKHKNISIVGDDDQSIYSWRQANPENINKFEETFSPVKVIKLEQNYRSTQNILKAANSIIINNTTRKSKKLWSEYSDGDLIKLYEADDEDDESNFVLTMIKRLVNNDISYKDIAILFRINSLSRPLEETFKYYNVPYSVIGGTNFFDRPEIRDILSYMRFLANNDDEVSLFRIINNPKRGIGTATLQAIIEHSKDANSSIYSSLKDIIKLNFLGNKVTPYLEDFFKLIEKYKEVIFKPKNMANTIEKLVTEINYHGKLITEMKDLNKIKYRMNNIKQLIRFIDRYENDLDNFEPNIYDFLQMVSLQNQEEEENKDNTVSLMSVHSAKGLEFKIIFLVGVEEGLFPHLKTIEETGNIEEERRLFYVAVTRAREKLFLSYPQKRTKYNEAIKKSKSPFIDEIPKELLEKINLETTMDQGKLINSFLDKHKN